MDGREGREGWEHRTVYISRVGGDWQVDYGGGDVVKGLDAVLDEYGAKGWELVSLFPQAWRTEAGQFGPFEVNAYRAVFKRRSGREAVDPPATARGAQA